MPRWRTRRRRLRNHASRPRHCHDRSQPSNGSRRTGPGSSIRCVATVARGLSGSGTPIRDARVGLTRPCRRGWRPGRRFTASDTLTQDDRGAHDQRLREVRRRSAGLRCALGRCNAACRQRPSREVPRPPVQPGSWHGVDGPRRRTCLASTPRRRPRCGTTPRTGGRSDSGCGSARPRAGALRRRALTGDGSRARRAFRRTRAHRRCRAADCASSACRREPARQRWR